MLSKLLSHSSYYSTVYVHCNFMIQIINLWTKVMKIPAYIFCTCICIWSQQDLVSKKNNHTCTCTYICIVYKISPYSNSNYLSSTVSICNYCLVRVVLNWQVHCIPITVKLLLLNYCSAEMKLPSDYCTVWWLFIDIHAYCNSSWLRRKASNHICTCNLQEKVPFWI